MFEPTRVCLDRAVGCASLAPHVVIAALCTHMQVVFGHGHNERHGKVEAADVQHFQMGRAALEAVAELAGAAHMTTLVVADTLLHEQLQKLSSIDVLLVDVVVLPFLVSLCDRIHHVFVLNLIIRIRQRKLSL